MGCLFIQIMYLLRDHLCGQLSMHTFFLQKEKNIFRVMKLSHLPGWNGTRLAVWWWLFYTFSLLSLSSLSIPSTFQLHVRYLCAWISIWLWFQWFSLFAKTTRMAATTTTTSNTNWVHSLNAIDSIFHSFDFTLPNESVIIFLLLFFLSKIETDWMEKEQKRHWNELNTSLCVLSHRPFDRLMVSK